MVIYFHIDKYKNVNLFKIIYLNYKFKIISEFSAYFIHVTKIMTDTQN